MGKNQNGSSKRAKRKQKQAKDTEREHDCEDVAHRSKKACTSSTLAVSAEDRSALTPRRDRSARSCRASSWLGVFRTWCRLQDKPEPAKKDPQNFESLLAYLIRLQVCCGSVEEAEEVRNAVYKFTGLENLNLPETRPMENRVLRAKLNIELEISALMRETLDSVNNSGVLKMRPSRKLHTRGLQELRSPATAACYRVFWYQFVVWCQVNGRPSPTSDPTLDPSLAIGPSIRPCVPQ